MGQFAPERLKGLRLTKVTRKANGEINKVWSDSRGEWITMSTFPMQSQNLIRHMF